MTNEEWKERQHQKLRELLVVINEVADERPCDSEDDEEEYIWDKIEQLRNLLEDFFEEI